MQKQLNNLHFKTESLHMKKTNYFIPFSYVPSLLSISIGQVKKNQDEVRHSIYLNIRICIPGIHYFIYSRTIY